MNRRKMDCKVLYCIMSW